MSGWVQVESGVRVKLRRNSDGRLVVRALLIEADAVTSDSLRKIPMAQIERDANSGAVPDLPRLQRADRTPEDFAVDVATQYKRWAAAVPNPAAVMAAEHGVKLPTMHGWIREARLRGLLPKAQRGKS